MKNFRKFLAVFLLLFALVLSLSIHAFADEIGEGEGAQGNIAEDETVANTNETEGGEQEPPVTENKEEETVEQTEQTEQTEEKEAETAEDEKSKAEAVADYAKSVIDRIASSEFITAIISFVSGVIALLFMNKKSSTKLLGFIGEKADASLVKKEFKGIEDLNKDIIEKQEELTETVKQVSVALMLIAEYLPSVPSTVKGELFKTFSGAKDSGKKIVESLKETKAKIEEAVASIPSIDTSAIAKVLSDVQEEENTAAKKEEPTGTIDLG